MSVSVTLLKEHLSEFLRRANAGEEVVITSRNRPVARLIPAVPEPPLGETASLREKLADLPWVHWGSEKRPLPKPRRVDTGDQTLAEIVLEERRR